MGIGQIIHELRKQMGVTQENVANAVGVSAQAVSKWESGGTPDIELIPDIADYFGVSIDTLFGKQVSDAEKLDLKVIQSLAEIHNRKARLAKAFEYCWAIERGIMGNTDRPPTVGEIAEQNRGMKIYSQMLYNEGFTTMCFNDKLRYFLLMPEPESGWKEALGFKEQYVDFFEFIGKRNVLLTLFFLYQRDNKPFTPKLLEKAIGVDENEAKQIVEELLWRKSLRASTIELDDELRTVYSFDPNPAFIGMLAMCEELLHKPNAFYSNASCRTKPYFVGP